MWLTHIDLLESCFTYAASSIEVQMPLGLKHLCGYDDFSQDFKDGNNKNYLGSAILCSLAAALHEQPEAPVQFRIHPFSTMH
jgi:hypothetical protein